MFITTVSTDAARDLLTNASDTLMSVRAKINNLKTEYAKLDFHTAEKAHILEIKARCEKLAHKLLIAEMVIHRHFDPIENEPASISLSAELNTTLCEIDILREEVRDLF